MTDVEQLPHQLRAELALVVRIIFEEFERALAGRRAEWRKAGRILKIVLFGSHARGDWVDDPIGGYRSDFDILIVVNDERLTDLVDYWSGADDRLMRETTIAKSISAPVNLIVHGFADLNRQLERGRPFFVDMIGQGIALYEADGFDLARPRRLPPERATAEARAYFEEWFPSAQTFYRNALDNVERGRPREAVFLLHQTAERLYHCFMLVFTLYSPKSHRLGFLRSRCEQIDQRLAGAWPRSTRFERRCFELLRQAYVNARYSPHYALTPEELAWLAEHVAALSAIVEQTCAERIGG